MAVNDYGTWTQDAVVTLQGGTNIDGAAGGTNVNGTAQSNDTYDLTEVGVTIVTGATALAVGPAEVYFCREVRADVWEDHTTAYGVTVGGTAASTTYNRAVTVPGSIGRFRILVRNPNTTAGQLFTANVWYRQSQTT